MENKNVSAPPDLPEDIKRVIDRKLVLYADKVRFRAVCKSWNSITPKIPNLQNKQLPWLLHAVCYNRDATHGLLNPVDNEVYLVYFQRDFPWQDLPWHFVGSSNGWVACYDFNIFGISLLNPLTQCRIELPPRTKFPDTITFSLPSELISYTSMINGRRVNKVIWSSDPKNADCVVVASFRKQYPPGNGLVFCKPGDEKWTDLFEKPLNIVDVLFHKGKLHAVISNGQLIVFEDINRYSLIRVVASKLQKASKLFLVESLDGGLMMVEQEVSGSCVVYKHDAINSRWNRLEGIGDEIIFLGPNYSTAVSCSDFQGLKGNRIYFLDNIGDDKACIKVFNVVDESIEVLSDFKCCDYGQWLYVGLHQTYLRFHHVCVWIMHFYIIRHIVCFLSFNFICALSVLC